MAEDQTPSLVVCDACPVRCRIKPGAAGSCDRYVNIAGVLTRVDPLVVAERTLARDGAMVPFLGDGGWEEGRLLRAPEQFITGIGAGTTYPDYKPAPFIVASETRASIW